MLTDAGWTEGKDWLNEVELPGYAKVIDSYMPYAQSAIFYLKAQIVYKLQDLAYQTEELIPFREKLVNGNLRDEVAPLLQPDMDEASAVRFDVLFTIPTLRTTSSRWSGRSRSWRTTT